MYLNRGIENFKKLLEVWRTNTEWNIKAKDKPEIANKPQIYFTLYVNEDSFKDTVKSKSILILDDGAVFALENYYKSQFSGWNKL